MGIVLTRPRLVPAWLAAADHLDRNGRRIRNIVLEIESPGVVTADDRVVLDKVDAALRKHADLSIQTVAGTIFPQGLYKRHGAKGLSTRFTKLMKAAKKPGTWGTYAMRMMERRARQPNKTFDPLQRVIEKLRHASTDGNAYESAYEMGVHLAEDLDGEAYEYGCELPTLDATLDGAKISNMPCLSHLTFKLAGKDTLELTAIYRSHWYAQRALGNLVGLSHLLSYVAGQAELKVGMLVCISTDAVLDYNSWGGVQNGRAILAGLKA